MKHAFMLGAFDFGLMSFCALRSWKAILTRGIAREIEEGKRYNRSSTGALKTDASCVIWVPFGELWIPSRAKEAGSSTHGCSELQGLSAWSLVAGALKSFVPPSTTSVLPSPWWTALSRAFAAILHARCLRTAVIGQGLFTTPRAVSPLRPSRAKAVRCRRRWRKSLRLGPVGVLNLAVSVSVSLSLSLSLGAFRNGYLCKRSSCPETLCQILTSSCLNYGKWLLKSTLNLCQSTRARNRLVSTRVDAGTR